MPKMQTANVMVAIGGNAGNTVPRYNVTPSEVAVLRAIHGPDAVTEVRVTGTDERRDKDERTRLVQHYGRTIEGKHKSPEVDELFPGAAAALFHNFEDLEMPEGMFAAERKAPAPVDAGPAELDDMNKKELTEIAEAKGVMPEGRPTNAEIIEAIRGADETDEDETPSVME